MNTINYTKQFIDNDDKKAVLNVLNSDYLTQGKYITEFENKLSKFFNSKYCTTVSSGTAGLHLVGKALGWSKNDYVVTTPITFVASSNSIEYSGARTILCDIEEKYNTIDPNKLEKIIKYSILKNKKIKAVIAVDYAGMLCDWEALKYLSNKYNIILINDNCHGLGSKFKNSNSYALNYAHVVIQSFHPAKNITTGEGGAVLTNSKMINDKVRSFRTHGVDYTKKRKYNWDYSIQNIGYNYRLTDIQSALGISQLKKISKFTKKRNKIAKYYDLKITNNLIKLPLTKKHVYNSYNLYPVKINFNASKYNKLVTYNLFKKNGISLQVHYKPIHFYEYYKKKYKFKRNAFPISEKFYQSVFSIPIYYKLQIKEQNKIVNLLNNII